MNTIRRTNNMNTRQTKRKPFFLQESLTLPTFRNVENSNIPTRQSFRNKPLLTQPINRISNNKPKYQQVVKNVNTRTEPNNVNLKSLAKELENARKKITG